MFRVLSHLYSGAGPTGPSLPERVFATHPLQLSRWLEQIWAGGGIATWPLFQTLPTVQSTSEVVRRLQTPNGLLTDGLQSGIRDQTADPPDFIPRPPDALGVGAPLIWDHLIYAYLVESTGIMPIFSEVVRRYVVGETLEAPSPRTLAWVRATEELFFRDPPLFSIAGTVSELRPQARINRRNAYWRMFGMDLPHAVPARWDGGGQAWKADVGEINVDFRAKWSELLRQVWLGLENNRNSSGANPTDGNYVALLTRALRDMFNDRRRGGLLAREEFAYVTVLSWFHLTLQTNSPIVADLKADSTSPAERLAQLGQRVGMHPALRSRELFDLAEPMSSLLRAIEIGTFDEADAAAALFDDGTALALEMREIINQWQSATGERVKERPPGTVAPLPSQPLRAPTPGSGNGVAPGAARPAAATVPAPAPAVAAGNGQRA